MLTLIISALRVLTRTGSVHEHPGDGKRRSRAIGGVARPHGVPIDGGGPDEH